MNSDLVHSRLTHAIAAIESLREHSDRIESIANVVLNIIKSRGTIYTCGNGGSAAEAMHLSEELIGRYRSNRKPLRAICLNTDVAALTCIANDFGYEHVFARQVEALVTDQDLLIVFSTSGNSENIVRAIKTARSQNATVIGLLGHDGGACAPLCTHSIIVPSDDSAHVQEAHQVVLHIMCEAVERSFE